jgi:replicative DNA helicase
VEPEGSALFLRWPEFGYGLRRSKDDPNEQADVVSWRGAREARDWPGTLFRRHTGLLPWGPDADYAHSMRGDQRSLPDEEMTIR